jgi:hypothetical protein
MRKSMLLVFYSGTQPFFLPQITLLPSCIFGLVLLLKSAIQIVHETWWGNLSAHGVNRITCLIAFPQLALQTGNEDVE